MKIKTNIYTNILSFIALLILAITGFILWFVIPKGNLYQGGRNTDNTNIILGLDRHDWVNIHNYVSLIFVILMLIHLILHWSWIKNLPKLFKQNK